MLELLVATQNLHKLEEIQNIFSDSPIRLKSLADMPDVPEIIENGKSFKENAAIKARFCFDKFKCPVFGDDSGLEVQALNNAPGIFSARYAGPQADYSQNNQLLLSNLKDIPDIQRTARFVCTICYKDSSGEYFFTGTTEGTIIRELVGEKGFGYDPLFYLPELKKTFAELNMHEKNKLSHRGKAIRKLATFLDESEKN